MSSTTIRIVVAIVLIAHGVGHALGVLAAAGVKLSASHAPDSWLFSGLVGDPATRVLGALLWLASLGAFVAAGLALVGWGLSPSQWRTLAVTASVLSIATLALFWHGFPFLFPNKLGALAVDVALLASVLWLQWPASLAVE